MTESHQSSVHAAFEMLIEEIEVEIECVHQHGSRAVEEGDYRNAKALIERAEQISTFREKITSFRSEWEILCASAKDGESSRNNSERRQSGRLPRGLRTPEKSFRLPILKAIQELGGSAQMSQVMQKVREGMSDILLEVDHQPLASSPEMPRWRNTAQWTRNTMVKEGLLRNDSPRGIWELSEKGLEALEKGDSDE